MCQPVCDVKSWQYCSKNASCCVMNIKKTVSSNSLFKIKTLLVECTCIYFYKHFFLYLVENIEGGEKWYILHTSYTSVKCLLHLKTQDYSSRSHPKWNISLVHIPFTPLTGCMEDSNIWFILPMRTLIAHLWYYIRYLSGVPGADKEH